MLDNIFKLSEHNTDVKTEVMAGVTTFMVMAYIIALNPSILSQTGMDATAVLLATCFASFIGTVCLAFSANIPFAISAGMGINAFFAYTVCGTMGFSWRVALLAVFIEGILFILLALTHIREVIIDGIPEPLKKAIAIGIGFYVVFIGLQNAGLVVAGAKLVTIVDFTEDFHTKGICALLAFIGIIVTFILHARGVRASLVIGILFTWMLGIIMQLFGVYRVNEAAGFVSLIPKFSFTDFSSVTNTFAECFDVDISAIGIINFLTVVFSFLFVDFFDTIGTLIGVSSEAGLLADDESHPHVRTALTSNAIATSAGALMGTSTTTIFVESAAGVAAGGRTGLTALTTGVLFLVSSLFAPIFISIPSFATAPALVVVGYMMFCDVTEIDFSEDNIIVAIPAFLCIVAMPLFYSIFEGISLGIISYTALSLACGKGRKVNPVIYVLAVLFVLKYIFL